MTSGNKIITSIKRASKDLVAVVGPIRNGASPESLEIAAAIEVLIGTIAYLNEMSSSEEVRELIDLLVEELPRNIEDRRVNLADAIPDPEILREASGYIGGAYHTNVLGAFTAIYNARVEKDLERMGSKRNGPLGFMGGIGLVIGEALVGPDKTPPMMEILEVFTRHLAVVSESLGGATGKGQKACFIATACFEQDSSQVTFLRRYRDAVLKKTTMGRRGVFIYYKYSPSIARRLSRNRALRSVARGLLLVLLLILEKKHPRLKTK